MLSCSFSLSFFHYVSLSTLSIFCKPLEITSFHFLLTSLSFGDTFIPQQFWAIKQMFRFKSIMSLLLFLAQQAMDIHSGAINNWNFIIGSFDWFILIEFLLNTDNILFNWQNSMSNCLFYNGFVEFSNWHLFQMEIPFFSFGILFTSNVFFTLFV